MAGARVRVYITKGSKTSTVRFAYNEEILEIVRGYVGRRWDVDNRVWIIYNHDVPKLEAAVKKLGHSVHYVTSVDDERDRARRSQGQQRERRHAFTDPPWGDGWNPFEDEDADGPFSHHYQHNRSYQQTGPRAGRPTTKAEEEMEWAVALFRKVGKKRARAVYRALAKVLHSDIGEDGDATLIQQLNDAYEPWKKME